MMPAAKHGDPQLGVDIHMCTVPPSPSPVPLPTPHTSIVFDPFDYVPYIGATVTVCGMKRATAGTAAKAIHIPPGFPFAPKLPDSEDEIFMGSSTVVADGEPFSFIAVPVLGCQAAGMLSPPRIKKKGPPKAMVLPTTVNLAIPTNVFVGGAPTISLMGMAFKFGFAALGKFLKSGIFKRFRQALFKNMDSGFLKCTILRAEPVNIVTGEVSVEQEDFSLPGRIPLQWVRSYTSNSQRKGLCGNGWETPGDMRLEIDPRNGGVTFHRAGGSPVLFTERPKFTGDENAILELWDGALLSEHGSEFRVRTKEDRVYHFSKASAMTQANGLQEYPICFIEDLSGNWMAFERERGKLIKIQEASGRRIIVDSTDGLIRSLTLYLPEGGLQQVLVTYEYDASGNLMAVADALGHPYQFEYDNHHLVRHTDRNGLSFYYEFCRSTEEAWRVVHAWGDGGLYDYHFDYIDTLNERRITDSLGHVSTLKLSEIGLPICEIDPLGGMTVFEYDDVGHTTAVVDPDGNRTEYEYDERGNLLKQCRPDGECVVTVFNEADKAIEITDPNGALWQQEWDERALLRRQQSPSGGVSNYEYDFRGQLTGFSNPLDARTGLSYDGYGNLTRLTDALGHATSFSYDPLGNMIMKADPLDQRTRYAYDAKGRLTKAVLPSGSSIACAYDGQDNLIRYTDENGAVTRLEYFGLGEIKRRIQPDGHTVEYHYNTEEQLIGLTNQRGEHYELKRDPLGRIVEEIDYWGQGRRYDYSSAGYLKESIDPLGRTIQYETDPLGRILKKILPDPLLPEETQTESFEYDPNGNLIACENAAIRIERAFDPEGRLLEERQGEACVVTNTYDLNGNRITRGTDIDREGRHYVNTVGYRYDALNQAISVEVEGHDPLRLTRNALGQVTEEKLSTHVRRHFDYNPDGYLTSQKVLAAEGPLFEQSYRYDRAGNLVEKHDSAYGVDQYTYDPLGRLVSHLNPVGLLKQYLNDPAGDRLRTRIRQRPEGVARKAEWHRDGEYEGMYYRFDRAGNLVERRNAQGEMRFHWDANQRLIESDTDGTVTIYRYDCLGRRISKATSGVETRFFWDGDALLGDVLIGDGQGNEPITSRLREWLYYPETFEPLAMLQGHGTLASKLYLYHNDPNGCPTRLLDEAGDVVWAAQYSAWGGVERLLVDRVDNPIRLQGQYWDRETGLHYTRHRYYDADAGQFVSKDPIGLAGGENLTQYALNPVVWIDPLGLVCSNERLTREVIDEMKDRPGGEYAETWEFISKSVHEMSDNLDPTIGLNQQRIQALFLETMTNEVVEISANIDLDTGLFGIIKFAGGR